MQSKFPWWCSVPLSLKKEKSIPFLVGQCKGHVLGPQLSWT
jgi:hypothetical protein